MLQKLHKILPRLYTWNVVWFQRENGIIYVEWSNICFIYDHCLRAHEAVNIEIILVHMLQTTDQRYTNRFCI